MALTRDFKNTIAERVNKDPEFAKALLDEAVTLFLNCDSCAARLILRDLVNATIGFESLSKLVHIHSKSLHRMLSQNGNPNMDNLSAIISAMSKSLHAEILTSVVARKKRLARRTQLLSDSLSTVSPKSLKNIG